jgi:hypothetical protein
VEAQSQWHSTHRILKGLGFRIAGKLRPGQTVEYVISLYKVDTKALRAAVAKAGNEKAAKKNKAASRKEKTAPKPKTARN